MDRIYAIRTSAIRIFIYLSTDFISLPMYMTLSTFIKTVPSIDLISSLGWFFLHLLVEHIREFIHQYNY